MNLSLQTTTSSEDLPPSFQSTEQKLLEWLLRRSRFAAAPIPAQNRRPDDWQAVSSLCGYGAEEFLSADANLPLTASEIDYFRRNHRNIDPFVTRDFMAGRIDLPSPLAELYGLYRYRAQADAEAVLFVAQATGSTRVARIMADLVAIGGFANGMEFVSHMTQTYAISAAFDTSDLIDRANQEAARRLALPIDHPAHLLTLSPDDIGILASNIVDRHILDIPDFLEKATILAESRQDVNRLPKSKQFVTALGERDLPIEKPWVSRLGAAFARVFEDWVIGLPELEALMSRKAEVHYQ